VGLLPGEGFLICIAAIAGRGLLSKTGRRFFVEVAADEGITADTMIMKADEGFNRPDSFIIKA
jgi:hypothetical protein